MKPPMRKKPSAGRMCAAEMRIYGQLRFATWELSIASAFTIQCFFDTDTS